MTTVREPREIGDTPERREDAKRRLAQLPAHLDLDRIKAQIQREEEWRRNGRNQYAMFHSGALRIGFFGFQPGTGIEDHMVNGHLMIHVMEGRLEVSGGERAPREVGTNQFIGMDGMRTFTIRAHEETYAIIAFSQADSVAEPARGNELGTQIIL